MIFIKKNFRSLKKLTAIATFLLPSSLRIPLLRMAGFKIGRNVTISAFTMIVADSVEIGNDVYISPLTLIFNLKRVKLGNRVYISMGNMFHSHGLGSIEFGDFSATGLFCFIDCTCDVRIGRYSCVGPHSILSTHGSFLPKNQGFSSQYAPIKIGDYVWIMMGVRITPGVKIGDYVIAHTGAVIMSDIPDNSVYSHARDNFVTYPMSVIHRKTVNEEYLDKWKASLFSDLTSFLKDYFGLEAEVSAGEGFWQIKMPKRMVKIWDKDVIGDLAKADVGRYDVILSIDPVREQNSFTPLDNKDITGLKSTVFSNGVEAGDVDAMKKYSGINWLDVKSNRYNRARHSIFFDYLLFYFEMKYAVYFTVYEA